VNGTMPTDQTLPPQPIALSDPPAEAAPYEYSFLTADACASWQTGGKEDVLRRGLEAVQNEAEIQLTEFMQEIVHAVVYDRISPSDAGDLLKRMFESDIQEVESHVAPQPSIIQASLLDSVSTTFELDNSIPVDRLAVFLLTTGLDPELLRHELDAPILEKLELIRTTFNRMGIRKQTNLLYRQANFNLMREESEGFAKLVTELFTTSGNEPPTSDVVEDTVEKVKAMIGAFDLDVGRSLDVVLDVFSAVLVKQFRFFVKFLRASPWWPRSSMNSRNTSAFGGLPLWALPGSSEWRLTDAQRQLIEEESRIRDEKFWEEAREQGLRAFYTLGRRQVSQEQIDRAAHARDEVLSQWIKETGTVPPPGNRDAAQLLGFKLRFYSSSPARDENDVLPDNLVHLSALLIKIGFVSLRDLYAHIWRTDAEMDELKAQKLKEKQDREQAARPGAGVRNALASAGALADDTLPVPSRLKETATRASTPSRELDANKNDKPSVKASEAMDQKVQLLKSLLAVGALPEALFILGRFPWLVDLIPDLPEYIHRILHHALSHVYDQIRPLQYRHSLHDPKPSYETDIPGVPKGQVSLVETGERKVLKWAQLDKADSLDGNDYRFYWDEWNDGIPACRNIEDVFTLSNTLLPLVGVKIGRDPTLLLKFARIGKHSLLSDKRDFNQSRWLDLIKRILLPSLSLTKSNAGVVNEVFELISMFPVSVRYVMYLEWSSGRTSRNPDVKAAFDQARAETKDILKRISNTNVRPMARSLAKCAYANPHIVITTALNQIESYDSIAECFVEGARYFTDLGYDVLTWAIVSSMAKTGRNRTQDGGIHASKWLQALSAFAGKIYKRYGMMKTGPILQYVAEQLEQGNTMDLKMLEQIILSMGGIATDTSYNDAQLQAMGGGPVLQAQTILQLLDRRHDSKKTSERLMKSLQDTGLASKFLLFMAQQRQECVFQDGDVPLKAIGNTYDEVNRVMVQYLDLLRTNLSPEDFRTTLPDVVSLLNDFEIRPEIAFWVARPSISRQMQEYDEAIANDQQHHDPKLNGDVDMTEGANGTSEEDGEAIDSPAGELSAATPDADAPTPGASEFATDDCWHPIMRDLMTAIQPALPDEVVEIIGTGFYTTFWQLSLYDIAVPHQSYKEEMTRQQRKSDALSSDRSDVSVSATKKRELLKKDILVLKDKLEVENRQHQKASMGSRARLEREKRQWFDGKMGMDKQLNSALIEHCFLPRILSSPLDAFFCFKFVKVLQGSGTPNFRTLGFYDLMFKPSRLVSLIFMCTSKEADNLGKFFSEVLKDFTRWHASKQIYEKEAWGSKKNLPGYAMKLDAGKVVSLFDHESFQKVLFKWHSNLYNALLRCLTSPEYMHVRNAISLLRAVSTTYPAVNWHGAGLQKAVDKLGQSDKEDLKVASQALLGALHRREKTWVGPEIFRKGPVQKNEGASEINQSASVTFPASGGTNISKDKADVKDVVMTDVPVRTGSATPAKAADSSTKPAQAPAEPEQSRSITKPTPRPASTNGTNIPPRPEPPAISTREPRSMRSDSSKPPDLPRRLSPQPSSRVAPSSLPSRPDSSDPRNGHRDSPRRTGNEPSRLPPDPRNLSSRDARADYRGMDRPDRPDRPDSRYDEYERHSRREERPGSMPYPPRDERSYGRDQERRGPIERPPPPSYDRDRQSARPPQPERDREPRDSGPRPRPAPSTVLAASRPDLIASSKRDAPQEPLINPARASLIEGTSDQKSAPPSRYAPSERPTRPSRPGSPHRDDDRRGYTRHGDDDRPPMRPGGPQAGEMNTSNGRSNGPASYKREGREPRQFPPVDMQHGRLEQDSSPRTQSTPERPQQSDVPSGPRARPQPGSGPRTRAPQLDTSVPPVPTTNVERPTPTGPSRRHTRTSSYAESPSGPSANAPAPDSAGVHPSRLSQIDAVQGESSRPNQSQMSPQSQQPPAGPRGNAPMNAPSGPSPTSRAPPAGPHSGDVSGRGGRNGRTALSAVNSTLAQAGGTSIRGRGGGMARQNSGSYGSHMAPPPPPPPPPPPSNHGPGMNGYPSNDLFGNSNPNDVPVGNRPPSTRHDSGRADRRSDLVDPRDSDRRSSRHSGQHHEPHGERDHIGEREPREGRDESKSAVPPGRRDERPSRNEHQQRETDERRSGYPRTGPREDSQNSRKHGREEESNGYGRGGGLGSGGRGGASRSVSENKRPRRGP
jgi:THO complex subunit 2